MNSDILEPDFWSLGQLFRYKYIVPIYQRPYSWQKEEVKSLLIDIYDSYENYLLLDDNNRKTSGLYVGNIILHKKDNYVFDIIDGQQRLTTFTLILLVLYSNLKSKNCEKNNLTMLKIQGYLWKLDRLDNPLKDQQVIELGSIEKDMLIDIFDYAYSYPKKLGNYIMNYKTSSVFEDNVKKNYYIISEFININLKDKLNSQENLLLFSNFFLRNVWIISILNCSSENSAFGIFESINSKGKKLEDIDLIKTYIFSHLEEKDYSYYSKQWGELIIKTKDNLYDYLKVYINAYIKFYTHNISYNNFVNMENEFIKYFKVDNISCAFTSLIDDMISKVDYYKALSDINSAHKLVNNKQFRFFYLLFIKIKYEHPKPLFFRAFCDLTEDKIDKNSFLVVILNTIKMMIVYLTVSQKDSKDIIPIFANIFDNVYSSGIIQKDVVLYEINKGLSNGGINRDLLLNSLCNLDVYSKNKKLGSAIISIYDSVYSHENENKRISWDEAYSKLSTFGSSYSLDHILVQMPNINDKNLKYYKLGSSLILKDGSDFPDNILKGMDYDEFKGLILNRIGNFKLKGLDSNSSRGNTSDEKFSTYTIMNKRTIEISKFFVENCLDIVKPPSTFNPENIATSTKKKLSGNFNLSMNDLNITGAKVGSVSIEGTNMSIKGNKEIIEKIFVYLFEKNKEKILNMANSNWSYRKRVLISNNKNEMKSPFELIANSVYIETNLSSADIIDFSRNILNEFDIPLSAVSIFIPD